MADEWTIAIAATAAGLAGLMAGAFGGLRAVVEAYLQRWKKNVQNGGNGKSGVALLSLLAEFNTILSEVRRLPTIGRVLVYLGHNCGGLPEDGKRYTVKCQTGWDNTGNDAFARFAFDLEIDKAYADMLHEIHRSGSVSMEVEKMPPCFLRTIYRREKVTHSIMHLIGLDAEANTFAYASFASYTGPISEDDRAGVELTVSRLKTLVGGGIQP